MAFQNGVWTQPTTEEQQQFAAQISTKIVNELVPTQEMVQAIAEKMEGPTVTPRVDLTSAIENIRGAADIVIPIYGSLHVVKPCIESVLKHTNWPFHLILVDDCSPDEAVRDYLQGLVVPANFKPGTQISVLLNQKNRGFPATVNRGVAFGDNKYVCILNSDTLATPGWLTRQLVALEADPKNVICNPCTNNTALINVPMYNGKNYLDMAAALAQSPNTPTHNEIMPTGFCFTLRRKLWDEVGPFDEAFGSGYGEETSFWMNALKQTDEKGVLLNNRAVIADDAYVFHERGTSFSQLGEDKHMGMRRMGNERFHKLHPDFKEWSKGFVAEDAINHVRNGLDRSIFPTDYKGNVAWVVKSAAACGGMNFIADIVNELIERGYNAQVCVVPEQYVPEMDGRLPVTNHLRTSPHLFKSREDFVQNFAERCFTNGIVFAAVSELTQAVNLLVRQHKGLKGYNHVQSYDVDLARLLGRDDLVQPILEAYKALPNVCSSGWIAKELKKQGAAVTGVILPGVNPELFHPRRIPKDERQTIAVLMSNEMAVIKGNDWATQFLKELEPAKHPNIRVLAIGPTSLDIRGVTCLGALPQSKMAEILGSQVDVLVDPAAIHSYGLPVLEALYSGAAAVCRPNKGVNEYKEVWNDRVAVTNDPHVAAREALHFLTEAHLPVTLPGITTNRAQAINDFIEHVFPGNKQAIYKIEMVTPHMRKHGGPTTLVTAAKQLKRVGHDVALTMNYTDWNPEVLKTARPLPVRTNWKLVQDDLNVVIINSDNPFAPEIMKTRPGAKFVMYKLSHNPRFQKTEDDNLKLPWDHIMTSTNWLRNVCLQPMAGWTHPAWPEDKVSVVGWYHYGHSMFAMNPANRTYGSAMAGFKLGTLIHDHPLKGTFDAMAAINGLKRKYNQFFHAAGFGEIKANVPEWMQYFRSADRKTLADAFQQIDVWLGASHSEGLGRLALEAMSAGAAVVTTDTGAEFLRHEENCLLYPVGNPQRGAEMVDRLVNDQELFTKLVVNGFRTAEGAANPDNFQHNLNVVMRRVMQ